MMPLPERFAAAAEALIGTRYRLHGRNAMTGVDCVGLVSVALERAGQRWSELPAYGLRNFRKERFIPFAHENGFATASGPIMRGDLLLTQMQPTQLHLLIAVEGTGFIHAHAGMRRVVRQLNMPTFSIAAHWRLPSSE